MEHVDIDNLRELKSKKARFGFIVDSININNLLSTGLLIERIRDVWCDVVIIEDTSYAGRFSVNFYTDDESIAIEIRKYIK